MQTVSVYFVAASLDGYIADTRGGVDWLAPFESESDAGDYAEFYSAIDGLIMGSRTYKKILRFGNWPYANKPCWVCSKRDLVATRPEIKVTSGSPLAVIEEIQALGLQRIWLVGGGQLAAAFRAQHLISDYIITVVPVILGSGLALFGATGLMEKLTLVESKPFPNGLVSLTYQNTHEAQHQTQYQHNSSS